MGEATQELDGGTARLAGGRKMTPSEKVIGVVALVFTVLCSLVTSAVYEGRLDARVSTIELNQSKTISRDEWNVFTQDLRDRLERIEKKLDGEGK